MSDLFSRWDYVAQLSDQAGYDTDHILCIVLKSETRVEAIALIGKHAQMNRRRKKSPTNTIQRFEQNDQPYGYIKGGGEAKYAYQLSW